MLLRAVGPGLEAFGLEAKTLLARPRLRVFRSIAGQDVPVAANEGWTTAGNVGALAGVFDSVGAFGLSESSLDAALLVTLEPGVYTAVVSGADGGTGIALAEVYVVSKDDVLAPQVDAVLAFVRTVDGGPALELRVAATDDRGVSRVVFFERLLPGGEAESLGSAEPGAGDLWSLLKLGQTGLTPRTFLARAYDAAGNVGASEAATFTFAAPVPGVAALGPNGEPLPGGLVTVDAEGNLGPFGVVAGGGGAAGQGAGLMLGFPSGGRIVEQEGRKFVEFTEGEVRFGRRGALQLIGPLVRGAVSPARFGLRALADDEPVLLPLENLTVEELAEAFGLAPGEGLGVELFGVFKLRLISGTFSERGIEQPVFAVQMNNLPLPARSSAYAGLTIDFSDPDEVRLPFHGEFTLPEARGQGATIRVPRSRPIILILRSDGSMALRGRVQVGVPGDGRYTADLSLDDPNYAFGLSAAGVEIPFLDSFSELLPDNVVALVPPTTDGEQLDFATRGLESFARAFHDFSAAAAAAAPVGQDLEDGGDRPPGDVGSAFARLLDAWAFSAASPVAHVVADDAVADVLDRLARVGSGATDLMSSTEYLASAARLRAMLADPAFDATQPGARARLDAAMLELERAVFARCTDPAATASFETVIETIRLVLDVAASRQLLGFERVSPLVRGGIDAMLRVFLDDLVVSLGVGSGQFDPAANPRISGLNRYTAVKRTVDLVDALAILQLLDMADSLSDYQVPGDELLTQLAARGASALRAELAEAESAGDARTFVDLVADLLDFEAARQLGIFPNTPEAAAVLVANGLPDPFDFESLEARYAAVRERDLSLEVEAPTVAGAAREVARINRLADHIPAGLGQAVLPAHRALQRLEDALAQAVAGIAGLGDPDLLVELIDAGTQQARLTRRLAGSPAPAAAWETDRLVAIVDRFIAVAAAGKSWEELYRAARLLLAGADDLRLEAENPALPVGARTDRIVARRDTLLQAARLIQAARGVAAAVWIETEAALAAAGQLGVDALLPGNIEVESIA
ncbi:MAG: hypothetical protein MUE47_08510, partial [Acidobacteria bacterium]|nr:hypothetical protein [Acidobacteriota bacterium]